MRNVAHVNFELRLVWVGGQDLVGGILAVGLNLILLGKPLLHTADLKFLLMPLHPIAFEADFHIISKRKFDHKNLGIFLLGILENLETLNRAFPC